MVQWKYPSRLKYSKSVRHLRAKGTMNGVGWHLVTNIGEYNKSNKLFAFYKANFDFMERNAALDKCKLQWANIIW